MYASYFILFIQFFFSRRIFLFLFDSLLSFLAHCTVTSLHIHNKIRKFICITLSFSWFWFLFRIGMIQVNPAYMLRRPCMCVCLCLCSICTENIVLLWNANWMNEWKLSSIIHLYFWWQNGKRNLEPKNRKSTDNNSNNEMFAAHNANKRRKVLKIIEATT